MSTSRSSSESSNSKRDLVWIERYCTLVRFVARMERMPREVANPVDAEEIEEKRLSGWARYQRRRKERGLLPVWQRELLEQMPEFSWDPLGDQWDEWFEKLQTFLVEEGRMPRYRTNIMEERALAAWVHKQRFLHGQGALTPGRIVALRSLPFRIV